MLKMRHTRVKTCRSTFGPCNLLDMEIPAIFGEEGILVLCAQEELVSGESGTRKIEETYLQVHFILERLIVSSLASYVC